MRAGLLDREITIQTPIVTTNAVGAEETAWEDLATVPANVVTESPRERIRANRIEAALAYVITIRYREGITSDMRILYEGKTLTISGPPREIPRRAFLEITALYET